MRQLVPAIAEVSVTGVLAALDAAPRGWQPFADEIIDFCDALSFSLCATRIPDLVALGFFARSAATSHLASGFRECANQTTRLVPRGLVFHVAPGNVDTLFIYSWLIALLTGNRNIVRISERSSPQVDAICAILRELMADPIHALVAQTIRIVSYGHDDEITRGLSASADLRVVWGGDATVLTLRAFPIRPTARDLTFPDRFSFSAVAARPFLEAPVGAHQTIAERFFNDAFLFDQLGCASPRLVVWCGDEADAYAASDAFFAALARVAAAKYRIEPATLLSKLTFAHGAAIDRPVRACRRLSPEVLVVTLNDLDTFDRDHHPGGGLFFEAAVPDLTALVPFVTRKDQTMTHFGFTSDELAVFSAALGDRALDRMVPFGRALAFDRFWDGYDLLQELTRRVVVETSL